MEVGAMDLDHALHVFKLCCYRLEREHLERESSRVDAMFLTEEEKQAISDIKKLVLEYFPLIAGETGSAAKSA
jgi:hypothetical protein